MNKQNLRNLKKEGTAKKIAQTAFELALEHGLDGVTVEDIVQKAGYSRRTFANYFTCKEEAVAIGAVSIHKTYEIEDSLAKIPENASLLDILYQLVKMQYTMEYIENLRKLLSLSQKYPLLEPQFLRIVRRSQIQAKETLLELSNESYDVAYIHILVGAIYGSVMPLIDGSLNVLLPGETNSVNSTDETITFDQFLETIFGYLRNGF